MKNLLLPLVAGAMALPAFGIEPQPEVYLGAGTVEPTILSTATPARGAAVNSRFVLKQLPQSRPTFNTTVNPYQLAPARAFTANGEFAESFEDWDGENATWVPEGWTNESHGDATLDVNQKWGPSGASPMLPAPSDGSVFMGISFASVAQDEWLITPAIEVQPNFVLTFDAYIDPLFLFTLENVDWETGEFQGDPVISATLQVMAKAEGDTEWTKLWDAVDELPANPNTNDLMNMTPTALTPRTLSLAEFADKKVQVAFRYVGTDGNTMLLDNVRVGYPKLDAVRYFTPVNTLYWGYDDQPGWGAMGLRIAQYGIGTPLTFVNDSPYTSAEYHWTYMDPNTNEMVTSDDETLTIVYDHDYSSDFTTRNNMYYPVTLTASMPGASDGTYGMSIDYMQAGGRAEFMTSNAGLWQAGLLPYEHNTEGATYLSVEKDFGQMQTPITGYNANTDSYWYEQTFPGETDPGYDVYIEGIINSFYPSAGAPLMVEGAHVLALGKLAEGANPTLKLGVYALSDEGVPDFDNPVGEATCEAADMIVYNETEAALDFYTIPFSFTKPIVLDDSHMGYIVAFTGYHASGFEYFAPVQSALPNVDGYALSYLIKQIKFNSDSYRMSLSPLAYIEGPYGDCFNSFAINLVAHYGWLRCETEEVELPADGSAITVALDSYHPAENLAVTAPAGVEAEVTGRYGATTLSLKHNDAAVSVDGDVTVSAPGHIVTIKVKSKGAGVDDEIVADTDAVITGVYTLAGQQLGTAMPSAAGVYIVRYSDGTARKLVVK